MSQISNSNELPAMGPTFIQWGCQLMSELDASAYSNSRYKDLLSEMSEQRAREFLSGRRAAEQALGKIDPQLSTTMIKPLKSGAPSWPKAVVGSLTHSGDYALAAVASKKECNTLGIDLQKSIPPERDKRLLNRILSVEEISLLPESGPWGTILFSAKESGFKALSTLTMLDPPCTGITSLKLISLEENEATLEYKGSKETLHLHAHFGVFQKEYWLSLALLTRALGV